MNNLILIPIFFLIALLYSMAGLGGGSAYTSVLVLSGVPKETLPIIALGCNLVVATQGFIRFKHAGHFRWQLFLPFAITSIPFAYLGGRLQIPDNTFKITLAIALSLAALRLLFWRAPSQPTTKYNGIVSKLLIGSVLGLLAGVTGIGGGIYLIPTILFLGWATPQEASAIASLFIVVNSASGLVGQLSKGFVDWKLLTPLMLTVLVAGFIGSRIGATRLKGETLQKIVGTIILIAVGKLISNLIF